MKIIAETEHLILRNYEEKDFLQIYEIVSDPDVMSKPFGQAMKTPQDAYDFINHLNQLAIDNGVIELRGAGQIIGFSGILPCNDFGMDDVEIGIVLGKDYQGKAYATELLNELLRVVLAAYPRVLFFTGINNFQAQKFLQKFDLNYLGVIMRPDKQGPSFAYAFNKNF